jgi:hypothetical protein
MSNSDPGHTYNEHVVLALKLGVTNGIRAKNLNKERDTTLL